MKVASKAHYQVVRVDYLQWYSVVQVKMGGVEITKAGVL